MAKPHLEYSRLGSIKEIDPEKFKHLVDWGFGRGLVPGYDFQKIGAIYVAQNGIYHGAVAGQIIGPDTLYIDKWVVSPPFQQNGVAGNLCGLVSQDFGKRILRAKPNNPANRLYQRIFGNPAYANGWFIYSAGLDPKKDHAKFLFAANKEQTLM